MKKVIAVFGACLFVFAAMVFSASLIGRNLIHDRLGETLVEQTDIKERIRSAVDDQLPQSGMLGEQIGTAVASILESDEVNRQLDAYLQLFIDDLVQGESSAKELNEALRASIEEQIDRLPLPSQGSLSKEQLRAALDSALDHLDIASLYDQALSQVREQLSPSQMGMLRLLRLLQSDGLYYGSLCVMIACTALFFLRGVRKGLRQIACCALLSALLCGGIWLALQLFARTKGTALLVALVAGSTQGLLYFGGALLLTALVSGAASLLRRKA